MQFVDEICNLKFFIFDFEKKDYVFMKFHFYLTYKFFFLLFSPKVLLWHNPKGSTPPPEAEMWKPQLLQFQVIFHYPWEH